MSKKVKVQITATQRVEYNQEVEMTMKEFKKLDQMLDDATGFSEKSIVAGKIELFLDLKDVCGTDDLEIDEFHLVEEPS